MNIKRIQFEYYTWNLSSEDIGTRDKSVEHIVEMGDYAVPLLIKKINNPYIFETHLEVYCLELITKAKTLYNKNNFHLESEAIPF